jgi:hypothetical protein
MEHYRELCRIAGYKPKDDIVKAVEEFGEALYEDIYEPHVIAKMSRAELDELDAALQASMKDFPGGD